MSLFRSQLQDPTDKRISYYTRLFTLILVLSLYIFVANRKPICSSNVENDIISDKNDDNVWDTGNASDLLPEDVELDPEDNGPEPPPDENISDVRSEFVVSALTHIISVASQEVGYVHIGPNTKYTGNFDTSGPDEWSAEFLSWCVVNVENELSVQLAGNIVPWSDSVTDCFLWFVSHGAFEDDGNYIPLGGDYVFLDLDNDGLVDRVGLVVQTHIATALDLYGAEYDEICIRVICGNMPEQNRVEMIDILADSSVVSGFGCVQ